MPLITHWPVPFPAAERMLALIEKVRAEGSSIGGVIETIALNVPAGLGEPVIETIEGELYRKPSLLFQR